LKINVATYGGNLPPRAIGQSILITNEIEKCEKMCISKTHYKHKRFYVKILNLKNLREEGVHILGKSLIQI